MKQQTQNIQKNLNSKTTISPQSTELKQQIGLGKAQAILSVVTSLNNCFLNLTTFEGKTIAKTSAGIFASGPIKKDSAFAALRAATSLANISLEHNIKSVLLVFKGFGKSRLSIATGLRSAGLKIIEIQQKISLPHNGCRPRKKRRL
jgi:small subunit ribosomal protein S11